MGISDKKKLFLRLKQLQNVCDEIWVPLENENHKSKICDRIAIIVSGMAAQAGFLQDAFEEEVVADENRWRMEQEFKRLYESEINRLKPPEQPPPSSEPDEDEGPGGIVEGM